MTTDYASIEALNWSTLKYMHESPALCRFRMDNPGGDAAWLRLGRAVHCMALEPEAFDARYAECTVRRNARDKAYQEWLAANEGKEALTAAEMVTVTAMASAVRSHPVAGPLLVGGRAEETVVWTDEETGILCKGRLDFITPHFVLDLKTVEPSRFSYWAWRSEVARRLYHAQVAWYHDGAVASGKLPAHTALPWIVRVKKAPQSDLGNYHHEAAASQLTERSYDAGRRIYRTLLDQYVGCTAARYWPDACLEPEELEVPEWAPGARMDDDTETEEGALF